MTDYQWTLIKKLIQEIFSAEDKQHIKKLDEILDANNITIQQQTFGFNHLGINYGRGGTIPLGKWSMPALTLPLVPTMNEALRFRKTIEFDQQIINQTLIKLIQPCAPGDVQAIRDTLPECVVQLDDWLGQGRDRTRPPAWTIENNPRDMRLYQKSLPKIEGYCAMKYLY